MLLCNQSMLDTKLTKCSCVPAILSFTRINLVMIVSIINFLDSHGTILFGRSLLCLRRQCPLQLGAGLRRRWKRQLTGQQSSTRGDTSAARPDQELVVSSWNTGRPCGEGINK